MSETPPTPDSFTPIEGWRWFTPAGDWLHGQTGHVWKKGENRAECKKQGTVASVIIRSGNEQMAWAGQIFADGTPISVYVNNTLVGTYDPKAPTDHHAPEKDCTCGFYAYVEPAGLREGEWLERLAVVGSGVLGRVIGWGKVQKHKGGWRSEFAEITALSEPKWAEVYGVEVCEGPKVEEQGAWDYGLPNPLTKSQMAAIAAGAASPGATASLRMLSQFLAGQTPAPAPAPKPRRWWQKIGLLWGVGFLLCGPFGVPAAVVATHSGWGYLMLVPMMACEFMFLESSQ